MSSNTMLVQQPGEFLWSVHGQDVVGSDADGCFPSDGGQRFIHWGACACFTLADWQRRKNAQQHFELGDITAFELAPDEAYSYVSGHATAAYNNPRWSYAPKEANAAKTDRKNAPKLDLFTRSLVFFGGQYLVVFDRVNALDPSYRKAWLLHSINKPEVGGKIVKADVPGRIEVSPTASANFDNFLHLITIGDTKSTAAPPCELIEADGKTMAGLSALPAGRQTGGWVVLFGRRGEVTPATAGTGCPDECWVDAAGKIRRTARETMPCALGTPQSGTRHSRPAVRPVSLVRRHAGLREHADCRGSWGVPCHCRRARDRAPHRLVVALFAVLYHLTGEGKYRDAVFEKTNGGNKLLRPELCDGLFFLPAAHRLLSQPPRSKAGSSSRT